MALEDLTGPNVYLNALVPANPTADDDRSEGDNHIRGHKNVTVNSFPQVAGPVNATHVELSACAGAVSAFQPQIDALDARITTNESGIATNASAIASNSAAISSNTGRIAQNEADIAALQSGGGGSVPAVRGGIWTNTTAITATASWQQITGAVVQIPPGWGTGSVKLDASVNSVIASNSGVSGQQLLLVDFAIFVNGILAQQFLAAQGVQNNTALGIQMQDERLVSLTGLITGTGGQTLDLRAKKNGFASAGMTFTINSNGVESALVISRVDITA